jgi:hypothetical protein
MESKMNLSALLRFLTIILIGMLLVGCGASGAKVIKKEYYNWVRAADGPPYSARTKAKYVDRFTAEVNGAQKIGELVIAGAPDDKYFSDSASKLAKTAAARAGADYYFPSKNELSADRLVTTKIDVYDMGSYRVHRATPVTRSARAWPVYLYRVAKDEQKRRYIKKSALERYVPSFLKVTANTNAPDDFGYFYYKVYDFEDIFHSYNDPYLRFMREIRYDSENKSQYVSEFLAFGGKISSLQVEKYIENALSVPGGDVLGSYWDAGTYRNCLDEDHKTISVLLGVYQPDRQRLEGFIATARLRIKELGATPPTPDQKPFVDANMEFLNKTLATLVDYDKKLGKTKWYKKIMDDYRKTNK